MRVKIYCDLYISGHWMNKKDKLVEKLHKNRLQPMVGLCSGYYEAVDLVEQIAEDVYTRTGQTDIRSFILERQKEFEMTGRTG